MVFVALRKESVDRNDAMQIVIVVMHTSLSARRAWIEIVRGAFLLKKITSLSARRAWIEIAMTSQISVSTVGRSPQGERG